MNRPLVLVVPHARGGSTDTAVRIVTAAASTHLGRSIHVINLEGISGGWALDLMVDSIKAKPDGCSLCTANSSIILSPLICETKYRYMDEIRPIAMYAEEPFLLAVGKTTPWRSLEQFVAFAKKNPGRITYGHSGAGNVSFVVAELVKSLAGIDISARGYDGGGKLAKAFEAGEVECLVSNRPDLHRQLKSGDARILAVAAKERISDPLAHQAPTFIESGYDINAYLRQGIGVSIDVPERIYQALSGPFESMIREPAVREAIEASGMSFKYMPGPEYRKLWDAENARWLKALDGGLRERISDEARKSG